MKPYQDETLLNVLKALAKSPRSGPIDDKHWENMYGDTQYQRR